MRRNFWYRAASSSSIGVPADRLLRGTGVEVSARGVAGLYREWIDGFVIDHSDAALAPEIEAMGLRVRACDSIMRDVSAAARLAEAALSLAAMLTPALE